MSTQTSAESCEICGRAMESEPGHLCYECSQLVPTARQFRRPRLWRTWLVTLTLLVGGATAYCLAADQYSREIFWFLVVDHPLALFYLLIGHPIE